MILVQEKQLRLMNWGHPGGCLFDGVPIAVTHELGNISGNVTWFFRFGPDSGPPTWDPPNIGHLQNLECYITITSSSYAADFVYVSLYPVDAAKHGIATFSNQLGVHQGVGIPATNEYAGDVMLGRSPFSTREYYDLILKVWYCKPIEDSAPFTKDATLKAMYKSNSIINARDTATIIPA